MTDAARESFPDETPVALLLIDVINDLEFDGGEDLIEHGLPMARAIAALKTRARATKAPCIYVNDNFGRWRSDFQHTIAHVVDDDTRGRPIAELLHPTAEDYFVLKPKHSGFFGTTLAILLEDLGARTLILSGMAGNNCVLATATDAYMRGYKLIVPADCVASERAEQNQGALAHMADVLKADTRPSSELDFEGLFAAASESSTPS
jgi:nicotinamidase-related amidase